MPKDLFEQLNHRLDVTRKLCAMTLELASEGKEAIRVTSEKLVRSRRILNSRGTESSASVGADLFDQPSSTQTQVGEPSRRVRRSIVVIGGSAGSMVALRRVLDRLPDNLDAAFFVVQHTSPTGWQAVLSAEILRVHTSMPVLVAGDMEAFQAGCIYICPPNHHLTLENGLMRLEKSPIENHSRPSIDVLFRSAAAGYGRRAIGALLSGTLSDGTAGLWQIKKRGGIAMVQDTSEAQFAGMPRNAIENIAVDYVLSASGMGDKLAELIGHESAVGDITRLPSILIVEDQALVARNLLERLNELSYSVCGSVESGEEAIDVAAEKHPDLILMDIQLAGQITGVQAARSIFERLQIPVVFVTAHGDLQTLAQVKTTEYYGYLVKPFHGASLQAAVELALDRRQKELRQSG